MADINNYLKSFKEMVDYLDKVANKATKTKGNLDPATKSVKNLSSAMYQAVETADELADSFDNLNKKVGKSDFDAFVKGTSSFKSFSKEVQEAEKKITDFYDEVEKSIKVTKYLSVESSEYLDNIRKVDKGIGDLSNALQEKRDRLESVKKSMSGLDGNLKELKKSLAGVEKSGALSFFNNMKGKLSELKGAVSDQAAFSSFEKRIKDLDNVSIDKLPDEMKNISEEFKKLKFDNKVLSESGVKKLGKSFSDGMRKTFDKIEDYSKSGAEGIAKNLDAITSMEAFKNLTEESKGFITGFISDLRSAAVPFDELEKKMTEFSAKVESLSGQESGTIKENLLSIAEKTKEGMDLHQKLNKMLEKPKLLSVSLDFETAKIDDTINALEEKSNSVGLSNEEQKNLDLLVKQKKEIETQITDINKLTQETLKNEGAEKNILELQKQITEKNNKIIKQAKMNNALAQRYIKVMDEVEKGTAGEKKVQEISDSLVKAHGHLEKYKEYMESIGGGLEGMLGGLAGKLGGAMKGIGDGLMKYKASFGILTSLVGALETVIKVDAQVKKAFKEVADTGALINVPVDQMKDKLDATFKAANNRKGLYDAMIGVKGAVSLTKEEIVGMGGALNSAGMSMQEMEKQTHAMNKSLDKSDSGIKDAAEMAHVLGKKMGKSDNDMAAMIGDLSYQYGASLQGIKDGFSDVASAAQASSMGANKFMSVVQAATAGMALYGDQIKDTAASLSKMQGIGLSGKEQGAVAKTSAEFAQDPKKVQESLAIIMQQEGGKQQLKDMAAAQEKRAQELKAQADKEEKGSQAQLRLLQEANVLSKISTQMNKAADENNMGALLDVGRLFKRTTVESQQKLVGGISKVYRDVADKAGDGSEELYGQLMDRAGLGQVADIDMGTGGLASAALRGEAPGQGKEAGEKKSFEKNKEEVAAADQLTQPGFARYMDALKSDFTRIFGGWTTVFAGILTALIALQTLMMAKSFLGKGEGLGSLFKNLFSKGGGPPGPDIAKTGGGMFSKVAEGAKGLFSAGGEGGGFAKVLGKSIKPLKMLGAGAKVLGKFMGPVGLAMTAMDAVSGWGAAGELSGKGDKATTGDKVKGAISGIVEGLSFGLLDKKQIFDFLPGGDKDKLAPKAIDAPKTSALGQATTSSTNPQMGKSEVNTEKVIKEATAKSPYAITQHFYGVTDKNFYDQVKVAMLRIEQERNTK